MKQVLTTTDNDSIDDQDQEISDRGNEDGTGTVNVKNSDPRYLLERIDALEVPL